MVGLLQLNDPINDRSTTIDMLKTENDLKSLTITNDIIKNIEIYSFKNNVIVDSATCGLYLDRYYLYNNIKGVTFADWQEEFLKPKHRSKIFTNLNVINLGQSSRNIIYAESLPLSQTSGFKGNVFIYLDEEYLLSQFDKIPYQKSGFVYILDENNKSILNDNRSGLMNPLAETKNFTDNSGYFFQNFDGKEMFITYYKEMRRNWVFVAALPKNQVLAPILRIRLYIDLLILFTVLSGGFLIITSVLRLSKPISNIFAIFAEKNQNFSYNDFEYEISKLVDNNEKMKEMLNNQLPELKTSIIHNLLFGGYHDPDEIKYNLQKINIKLDAKYYIILIVTINELNIKAKLEEISAQKIYINSILTQYFNNIQGIYNLDFQRTILLLSFENHDQDSALKEVESITKNIIGIQNSNVQMSVSFTGDITDDILKIQKCFLNAYTATNYTQKSAVSNVQWYINTIQNEKLNFYYPIELEAQLISFASVGNTTKLSEVFLKIDEQNKNIIMNEYNPVFYNLLLSMNSTLIRIINQSNNHPSKITQTSAKITAKIETKKDLQKTYYLLKDAFISIALINKAEQGKCYSTQQSQILQFINDHFTDSQLSLTSVADTFHITEGYLSNLFKHISGENFSKYVEKLRLQRANDLIERGFKINEVAQMSGYNSPQVFRRAYRRNFGVAPTCRDDN